MSEAEAVPAVGPDRSAPPPGPMPGAQGREELASDARAISVELLSAITVAEPRCRRGRGFQWPCGVCERGRQKLFSAMPRVPWPACSSKHWCPNGVDDGTGSSGPASWSSRRAG